ncbi:MAG TPA: alanyl-tRNA editing protein [Candidatus Ventrimonas merdavium]|nr:alanyl-tRNA editing protein [Candidatus Ventrimonas merdavium]
MTEKLFYQDSHLREFAAAVLACVWNEKKERYEIELDRTAFFPESGGQYADTGTLGGVSVTDVRERDGAVIHLTDGPLTVGETVTGVLDYEDRFSKMQQHTGEHIVSGLVHRQFGYDNVGFHLGKELVTMDFNGVFQPGELRCIEWEANQAVAQNLPIQVTYPSDEELAELDYRSKKEISGQVRIVTVPGYDVCACCAPHVECTGEIGMIRLIDAVHYKGGTRVTMVCGFRALADYRVKEENVREISRLLSAKPYEAAQAVAHLKEEAGQWREKVLRMQTRYLEQKLAEIPAGTEDCILFEEEMDKNVARRFADGAMEICDGLCGIFLGNDRQGYQFTLCSKSVDLKAFLQEFYQKVPGKGGGKNPMVQGTVTASQEAVQKALGECERHGKTNI